MVRMQTVVLLLSFLTKSIIFFASLNLVAHHHGLVASTYKFINSMKSNHVAIFFIFNTVIIALLVGNSKPSERDHDKFSLLVSLPPVYEEEVDDTGRELPNDESDESHGFSVSVSVPSLVYEVEDKDDNESDDDEYYHGFDGYEEDNEGGYNEDEDEDDDSDEDEEEKRDLERRIQEFIDEVYKKWAEELYNDRLPCLPPPHTHFSTSS